MSNHARRYGRRAPKRARAIQLFPHLTDVVPAHPAAADNLARLNGWQMLGNDRAGDCVAVTWANFRRLVTAILTGHEVYPTQDQVWALYRTQNPHFNPDGTADTNGPGSSADGGMDIQTLLEYLVQHGGPDGVKAIGFAQVNPHNTQEVKAALAIFGGLWVGVVVQEANQEQFNDGEPWDYDRHSPDEGGHSVLTGGYGPAGPGPLGGDERFITWAAETSFTDAFWSRKVEEAWVVIWPEHPTDSGFLAGVDLASFAADYTAITGRSFPAVVPPQPQPTPGPVPGPSVPTGTDVAKAVRAALTAQGV